MGGEILSETWFGSIWKGSRKEPGRHILGVLSFEVSKLMSKLVRTWECLSDKQILRLREEFVNSIGIHKLVSEDVDYLMDLALSEILENLISIGKSVAVLGNKCVDTNYHNLGFICGDQFEIDPKWSGWYYKLKKMEKKIKKMEKFVVVTDQLHSELEVLAELEQSLRQMKVGATIGTVKLLEFQQKVEWQRQEVKNLQEMSPWVRTHDYIVQLILRSLLTVVERVKYIYGVRKIGSSVVCNNDISISADNSFSSFISTSDDNATGGRPGRTFSDLGLGWNKMRSKNRKTFDRSPSSILSRKPYLMKSRRFMSVGLTGCMNPASECSELESYSPNCGSSFRSDGGFQRDVDDYLCSSPGGTVPTKLSCLSRSRSLLMALPSTLGHAALALHYANIIVVIEKLASAPHLISADARDDLYNMLPVSIRNHLRAKLVRFSRTSFSTAYDAALASEWSMAIAMILGWLVPLAHNMVKWQSERNFDRQRMKSSSIVLLVQTLYYADKEQTEAAIVELLMGLNYLSRLGKDGKKQRTMVSS